MGEATVMLRSLVSRSSSPSLLVSSSSSSLLVSWTSSSLLVTPAEIAAVVLRRGELKDRKSQKSDLRSGSGLKLLLTETFIDLNKPYTPVHVSGRAQSSKHRDDSFQMNTLCFLTWEVGS